MTNIVLLPLKIEYMLYKNRVKVGLDCSLTTADCTVGTKITFR